MRNETSKFNPILDFSSPFSDESLVSPDYPYLCYLDDSDTPQRVYLVVDYKKQTATVDWDRDLKSTDDELTDQAFKFHHFHHHPMKIVISPYMTKTQLIEVYNTTSFKSFWGWDYAFEYQGEYLDNGLEKVNWWLYDDYRYVYRTCDDFEKWIIEHNIGKESPSL